MSHFRGMSRVDGSTMLHLSSSSSKRWSGWDEWDVGGDNTSPEPSTEEPEVLADFSGLKCPKSINKKYIIKILSLLKGYEADSIFGVCKELGELPTSKLSVRKDNQSRPTLVRFVWDSKSLDIEYSYPS